MNNTSKKILAIDTSCDDTSAAVVENNVVLSNIIASQTELHKPYGGVFPTVAKQAHKENIDRVIALALKRAHTLPTDLAAVAVTQGPGLAPALEVGIRAAEAFSEKYAIPLIPVNHIEGHALSCLAQPNSKKTTPNAKAPQLPALAIIVSGGHTQFIEVKEIGNYTILGTKLDDAAGECLDKIGRMLNLGYPAGHIIEEFAKKGNPKAITFPLPMTASNDFNMSFSGLKTFARNTLEEKTKDGALTKQDIFDFCASSQYSVFRHIMHKLNKLLQQHDFAEVWLGGGVAANVQLRRSIRETIKPYGLQLKVPYTRRLNMDNGAMIGVAAGYKLAKHAVSLENASIERKPRLSIESNK
ncbi:MAG: tRNA (adenosine(37)-N6)-threonylcarbamoyltransferase complex transferase subunit TsaD [Candidatus Pacebacteria bacterium]|nr:tRNA (adenosine(37)-N6)-threonylcarbamoyltransferase complex transferase subunit TsaD [Candidatus Paceibacterota bacterium]PIR63696.1 MAG: tRNA (adenosine(37)-N6)-threonylcarbamoyltransferase complex transferase subunit TsaD [Candidatus Pacebacteria bacterium CG10_big_fil_rev_8_21_14_0_10_40_26]PIZ79699.1 MAG: tRNA (adenosine(37)-N6)-threonylcarbamoyltransferase complex transferase subunit TsaD [Candidatus Pacebacteria bacterium CG_4_10_14_0_2_um_filter_40_20]PJA68343.1 MAG: tRNA (adenosine(3